MLNLQNICKSMTIGGLTLLLAPLPNPVPGLMLNMAPSISPQLEAQRMRPRAEPPTVHPPIANTQTPAVAGPAGTHPAVAAGPPAPSATQAVSPSGLPPSMLEQPASPAHIELAQDLLSIQADNSSLNEILRTLAAQSGMKIDGLGAQDERVFGSFGPGQPQEVISDLLNGTPYNILMVGAQSNGAPSHLILTPTSNATASASASAASAAPVPQVPQPANSDAGNSSHSPFPFPNATGQAAPPGIKSPQALFEELQAMRQQQEQQQHTTP